MTPTSAHRSEHGYSTSYVAHDTPGEAARLHTLEAAFDHASITVLTRIDLPATAVCLDLGAGSGSIAAWLGTHRPQGRITATDTDTRFLHVPPAPSSAPIEVLRHNVVHDDLPAAAYDLVHARALLCHLPERDEVLQRAVHWLRPGGWLVIEDLTVEPADASPNTLFTRVTRAGEELLAATVGSDLRWASTLSGQLHGLGLHDVGSSTALGTVGDNSATDAFWTATFEQAVPALLDGGFLTDREIDEMRALHRTPGFTDTGISLVSAWGRKSGKP
ncbi:class I SAM-dependent methyltransferase [Streptomyces sp. SGAir0957]